MANSESACEGMLLWLWSLWCCHRRFIVVAVSSSWVSSSWLHGACCAMVAPSKQKAKRIWILNSIIIWKIWTQIIKETTNLQSTWMCSTYSISHSELKKSRSGAFRCCGLSWKKVSLISVGILRRQAEIFYIVKKFADSNFLIFTLIFIHLYTLHSTCLWYMWTRVYQFSLYGLHTRELCRE